MKTLKEKIEIMQHCENGGEIQYSARKGRSMSINYKENKNVYIT